MGSMDATEIYFFAILFEYHLVTIQFVLLLYETSRQVLIERGFWGTKLECLTLGVSSDFISSESSEDLAERSLTDKALLNQFMAIEQLQEKDKDVVKTLIDAFITKGKLKQLVL